MDRRHNNTHDSHDPCQPRPESPSGAYSEHLSRLDIHGRACVADNEWPPPRHAAPVGDRWTKPLAIAVAATVASVIGFTAFEALNNGDEVDPNRLLAASTAAPPTNSISTTPTTDQPLVGSPPQIDGDVMLYGLVGELADPDEDQAADDDSTEPESANWVEPTVDPESEWIDAGNGVLVPDVLLKIRFCESTNNYSAAHRYSSARGAYQFLRGSWQWYGHANRYGVPEANLATPAQQDEAAVITVRKDGLRPWYASRHCWADPNINPNYRTANAPPTTTTTESTTTTTEPTTSTESTTSTVSTTSVTAQSTTTSTSDPTSTAPTASTTASSTTSSDPTSATDTTNGTSASEGSS